MGQYRHLGGLIHHTGKVIREVRHRIMLAHEAFQTHKKRVFGSPAVSFQAKAVLYESLILSVLLHGAGTWIGLDDRARQALNTAHTHRIPVGMERPYIMLGSHAVRSRPSVDEHSGSKAAGVPTPRYAAKTVDPQLFPWHLCQPKVTAHRLARQRM